MDKTPRCVALGTSVHYIDHLAPVCELMNASLVVPDGGSARFVQSLYPQIPIRIERVSLHTRSYPDQIVFYSELYSRAQLRQAFGGGRPARAVFCPHGFSEKQQRWSADAALQDIFLVLGQYGLDQLKAWGVWEQAERWVMAGDLRYQYYRRHHAFFDALAQSMLIGSRPGNRTILYAPTWNDAIASSSAFEMLPILIRGLPAGYDLVVKLHPHLEKQQHRLDRLLAVAGKRPGVTILRNNPLTFPLLARTDIYIGDMSALAYDFLVFDRPMYFVNKRRGTQADAAASSLFQCGVCVDAEDYGRIYELIEHGRGEDQQFSERRRALWSYVHADTRTPAEVKEDILRAAQGPPPLWLQD